LQCISETCGRVLEGRAAGLFADRLRGLAVVLHLRHARADRISIPDLAAKARGGEDDGGVDAAVAVDELHVGVREHVLAAVPCNAGRLDQHVLGLAAIGARIHAQRTADGAGNTEIEFEPADIGGGRHFRHALVERGSSSGDDIAARARLAKGARRQPNHHARNATVAHDQVGADADDIDGNVGRKMREEVSEIVLIRRREQHLRGTTDAKPGELGERLVGEQSSAKLRHCGFELVCDVGKAHWTYGRFGNQTPR
jgi:hypothetical protein